ncbi:unnamed protein product [Callosobruchus maculatus]|uniref:Major facilitator superfamily (MFS) profile domain-containing protein n=1 Tax=Callosobruchus maculatus TaxID=64391 RepID=A0A653CL86_CALMS|nr:unnamed protein product [Callosobruchus maculatus]
MLDDATSTLTVSPVSTETSYSIYKTSQPKQESEYQETFMTIPPDGGWGWVVVFGAFVCFMVVDGAYCSFGIFLVVMTEELNCSKSEFSISAAIGTGIFCLSGPLAASLVNSYGYRIVGIAGSILAIMALLATSVAQSVHLVYFTYGVLGGFAFGLIYMPAVIAVGFYFEKWRGIATGVATCGAGFGGVVMPIMYSFILERVGWRQTFRILAVMLVLVAICVMLFKPIAPTQLRMMKTNIIQSSNFFTTYHNRMYPTLSEVTEVPTITLLQPRRLNKSSEVMIMSYPSASLKSKAKEDDDIPEDRPAEPLALAPVNEPSEPEYRRSKDRASNQKNVTTLFVSKKKYGKIPLHETKTVFGSTMRPMYRDDIFYDSSLNFLQRYRRTEQVSLKSGKSAVEYHMSVTRVATSKDIHEGRCTLCTEAVKRTLATMLDYKLLKSPSFILIALNASFLCLGFFSIYIFLKDRAEQKGIPVDVAVWLISIVGISNTVGRILCGLVAMCRKVNSCLLSALCLIIGGSTIIASEHLNTTAGQIVFAVVFGCFVACIPSLRTIIIVDTLGLHKLTNAIGLILMFQGVASLIGIYAAGLLRDITGNYKWSFYVSGICIIMAGTFFIPLTRIAKWEQGQSPGFKQTE